MSARHRAVGVDPQNPWHHGSCCGPGICPSDGSPLRPWKRLTPNHETEDLTALKTTMSFSLPCNSTKGVSISNPRDAIQEITQHCDDHRHEFGSFDPSVSGDGDMILQPLMSYKQWTFLPEGSVSGHDWYHSNHNVSQCITGYYYSVSPVIQIHILSSHIKHHVVNINSNVSWCIITAPLDLF